MKLKAQKREKGFKVTKGIILGVVYGDIENISIFFKKEDFKKVYADAGTSGIIGLDIEGESHDVIIKDIQLDNISGDYYHIDFYAVTKGQEMEATVSFEFVGESQAEKVGGVLNTSLNETHIKALPKDLPKHIEVNLEILKEVGDSIRLIDIKLPDGVNFVEGLDLESSVVSIVAAKSVADEEEANSGEVEIKPETEEGESKDEKVEKTEEKTE